MKPAEYAAHDATGLAELVAKRAVTPKEVARAAGDAVAAVNPELNAVVELYREQIDTLDESKLPHGPFRGVPFLLKRIGISERGKPIGDLGARLLKESDLPRPDYDSYVIAKFRRAGLNIMGYTAMPESAYTITVESPHQGTTHNPWRSDVVAGGSSTGSAVAVASGMVPMAHASDAAGSTRFPASVNGVIGLKPSRGRVSLGPDSCDVSRSKVSHFAVTRTVRDTAALLDAIEGVDIGEAVMHAPPERPFLEEVGAAPGRLRIALSNMMWHTKPVHAEVTAEMDRLGRALESLGHTIEIAKPDIDFERYREIYRIIYYVEGALAMSKFPDITGKPLDLEKIQPLMRQVYTKGKAHWVGDYADCFTFMNYLARRLGSFFETYDLLLTPALAEPVPQLGDYSLMRTDIDSDQFYDRLLGCNQYLPLSNLTGTPSISLPLCETSGGLPLGAHFIAPMGEEARLIRLAAQLEDAMPWRDRRPPVHVANA